MSDLSPEAYEQIYDVVKKCYTNVPEFLDDVHRAVASDKYTPNLAGALLIESDIYKFVFQNLNTNKEIPLFLDLLASRRINRKREIYELMFDVFPEESSYPNGAFEYFNERRISAPYIQIQTSEGVQHLDNRNGFGLEKTVDDALAFYNPRKLISNLYRNQRKVCVVKVNKKAEGTGFLIPDDLVLTNHHVVVDAINDSSKSIACLFDFFEFEDGEENEGFEEEVIEIPHSSPPGNQNAQSLSNNWKEDNLDYAVLRLKTAIGKNKVEGLFKNSPRSYINLNDVGKIERNHPVLILQHPEDRVNRKLHPQKLTFRTNSFLGTSPNEQRCRYMTNTEHGSSGSPCFNQHWEIIALHHAGHPDYMPNDKWNQGIPIQSVAEHLNYKDLLG